MRITSNLSERAVLQELGVRIARHRVESGLTQAALAIEAGVAKRTIERIEAGHGAELATIIRLLRVLKLAEGLDVLVPDQLPSPMALLKSQGRKRRRVRAPKHSARPPASSLPISAARNTDKHTSGSSNDVNPTTQRSRRNKNWTWGE